MKKKLRLVLLALATATLSANVFAEGVNYTSKLVNADMEQGVIGWDITFTDQIWKKNTKSQVSRPGYYGFEKTCLEVWKSGESLTDNSISQVVRNLPNGTYVFGAYIGASLQGTTESNKAEITGVTLFANESSIPVATDNPDGTEYWQHTVKFNVAAVVTDGTLKVGLNATNTNANFIIWDNATLYYYGETPAAEAMVDMRKIDVKGTLAIADTCLTYKFNVDTLAVLNSAIEVAKVAATVADMDAADEALREAMRRSVVSINDYRSFFAVIEKAKEIAAGSWSGEVASQLNALNALIASSEETYTAAAANRDEITVSKANLNEAIAAVEFDAVFDVFDELDLFLKAETEGHPGFGTDPGQYPQSQYDLLYELLEELGNAMDAVEGGSMSAIKGMEYLNKVREAIAACKESANTVNTFPIVLTSDADGLIATKNEAENQFVYNSPKWSFANSIDKLRLTVKSTNTGDASAGHPCFSIGEFYLYDGDGNAITLTESDIVTNAQEESEGPMADICDGDVSTYFHSKWQGSDNGYHYLEITLPAGTYSFSFGYVTRNLRCAPTEIELTSMSELQSNLLSVIGDAESLNPYTGNDPGYYNADFSAFYNALATAKALSENGGTDEEKTAAIATLEEQIQVVDEAKLSVPETGKSYRIVSAVPAFFSKQNIVKAMTVHQDTTSITTWWENAAVDSTQQLFSFTPIANDLDVELFSIKNVKNGLFVNFDGDNNSFPMTAEVDSFKITSLGYGQVGFVHYSQVEDNNGGMMHAGDHNSGVLSTNKGNYGGTYGLSSSLVSWETSANSASAWYICNVDVLPLNRLVAATEYKSGLIHLYEGVNMLTITANKPCAFDGFELYGRDGVAMEVTTEKTATSVEVKLVDKIETFGIRFNNAEGVTSLSVSGEASKLSALQIAYDEAVALAPETGENVGQFKNLATYNAALSAAQQLLENGGTDEQIEAAIEALKDAKDGMKFNMPEADKTYFIISALDAFETKHGIKMAIFDNEKNNQPMWSYLSLGNEAYQWKFIPKAVEEGAPCEYYLQNAKTGKYMGAESGSSVVLNMAETEAATTTYCIKQLEGTIMAIYSVEDEGFRLHANGHGGGANAFGTIVYWNAGVGTASAFYISEASKLIDELDFTEIEAEEEKPVIEGTYDLFGRRVFNPTKGLYIMNGKKVYVK